MSLPSVLRLTCALTAIVIAYLALVLARPMSQLDRLRFSTHRHYISARGKLRGFRLFVRCWLYVYDVCYPRVNVWSRAERDEQPWPPPPGCHHIRSLELRARAES